MQLIINATTVEELMEKVCAIANKFGVDLSENTKTPVTTEVVEAAKVVVVESNEQFTTLAKEEPKKKTKKEKQTVFSPEGTPAVVEAPVVEAVETKTFTKQDIANACQKVSEKHGLEIAREILATFGAKRISEVKEEEYAAFIEACEGSLK